MSANLYLYLFLFGLGLTLALGLVGLISGSGDAHGHADGGDVGGHEAGHAGALHAGGADAADGPGADLAGGGEAGLGQKLLPFLNLNALVALVTWGGGAGYLARSWLKLGGPASLAVAIPAGLLGAGAITAFQKLLRRGEAGVLDPRARLEGTLASVSETIAPGRTGEIIFVRRGVRQAMAARGDEEQRIERGTEVTVLRVQQGIAVVRPIV